MLKQIENSFLKSEVKIKLQLYILPIFCIYFYIYMIDNKNSFLDLNNTNKLNNLLHKKFDGSYLNLLKDIENFCLSKKIKINSLDYNKNKLLIKGKTSLKRINSLIIKIENINSFSKINSLNIEKTSKKNQYIFNINTEFKKFYIKTKNKEVKKEKKGKITVFRLKAIIDNHILLNNKWYTLNDFFGKYKIILINKNHVVLKYKDKNITLKLNKNE
jgi:hypothetical protein